jgi:hypothetical protein
MDFVRFKSPSHPALNALAPQINAEAEIAKIAPCLLAAIVARETGGRNILQEGMPPGPGCGVGLCQITAGVSWTSITRPTFQGYDLLNESDNLYVAAAYFLSPLASSAARAQAANPAAFATSCRGQIVYAVAAGFNAGWGEVQSALARGADADGGTTNGYAADILSKYTAFVAESHA